MKTPFFLLPGLAACGKSCSTLDGVVGKLAAIDERFRQWEGGGQVPTGTEQPSTLMGHIPQGQVGVRKP